jgi:hypothetical protein
MNPVRRTNDEDSNDSNYCGKMKPIVTTLPIASIFLVVIGLFSLIGNGYFFQFATAQQNTAIDDAISTNATRAEDNRVQSSSICAPTQTEEAAGTTEAENATAFTAGETTGGGNQSNTSKVMMYIEQACMAARNNDSQGVLTNLTLALNALGFADSSVGNATIASATSEDIDATASEDGISVSGTSSSDNSDGTEKHADDAAATDSNGDHNSDDNDRNTDENRHTTDTDNQDSECGGVTVGGTSAADDYGCPPDPDY